MKNTSKTSSLPEPPDVTSDLLAEVTNRIVDRFHPEKVILFGSHVWGSPKKDSDVDLLVIMEAEERSAQRSARVSAECRPKFLPMDIIVRTPSEMKQRLSIGDPFLSRILLQGKVLYER